MLVDKYQKIDIAWNDLGVSAPSKVKGEGNVSILNGTSGVASAGSVTSIMGPSGAGKTTMMDVLAGRLQHQSQLTIDTGEVLVNDAPIEFQRFRHSVGYLTQDDYLSPTETVRECLMFSAQLRLPGNLSSAEKKKQVDTIIEELGLSSCADTFIGSAHNGIKGVSGGEKRRTSVGVELITSPTCIFLDEPTSGLDSEIAVSIMRTLKSIAKKGRTVVLTIHQPNSDITEQFDHFILMAKGRVVYGGAWKDAVQAFAEQGFQCPQFKNPTDYFMKVASDVENIPKLAEAQQHRWVQTSSERFSARAIAAGNAKDSEVSNGEKLSINIDDGAKVSARDMIANEGAPASVFKQMWHLCARNARAWRRHPVMLIGEAVQYIFLGLFIGGMYWNVSNDAEDGTFDRAAASFFILVTTAFTPPFTVITVWQDERTLVKREVNQNVYSIGTFFWAKTLVLIPVETFFALQMSMISYLMFDFQADFGKFLIFAAVLLLVLFIAESLGLMFAMISPTADIAIVLASILFILLLSLTGFLTSSVPVYYEWVQYISFLRYANSAVFINEMKGLELDGPNGELVTGESLLDDHQLNNDMSIAGNFGILIGMLAFIRVASYVGLRLAYSRHWL